jgi:hypothetical protein
VISKPLDVRALEMLKDKFGEAIHTPEGRRFLRFIEPRAARQSMRRSRKIAKAIDARGPALPKKARAQDRKKDLHAECEKLCKLIVFHRHGVGADRMGICITCGQHKHLQWGHFIAQGKSKFLKYHPDNSGPQCAMPCNGPPGYGMYPEYRKAIEARQPGLAAKLERLHEETKGNFRWTVGSLEMTRDILRKQALSMGIAV